MLTAAHLHGTNQSLFAGWSGSNSLMSDSSRTLHLQKNEADLAWNVEQNGCRGAHAEKEAPRHEHI